MQLFGAVELTNGDVGAAMEFCRQGALVDALYGDQAVELSGACLLLVVHEAASGLAHVHAHKIVHRDVAARNVLLQGETAKLSDLCMARDVESADTGATVPTGSRTSI